MRSRRATVAHDHRRFTIVGVPVQTVTQPIETNAQEAAAIAVERLMDTAFRSMRLSAEQIHIHFSFTSFDCVAELMKVDA